MRYESRHCCFEVPEDWQPVPPFGFREPERGRARSEVQILERWLDHPVDPALFAFEQSEVLPHLLDEFELVSSGPPDPVVEGVGHQIDYSYRDDDGDRRQGRRLYLACGPFVAELEIMVAAEPDPDVIRVVQAVSASFRIAPLEAVAGAARLALFESSETEVLTDTVPRLEAPDVGVTVPCPGSWHGAAVDGSVVLTQGEAEISLRRSMGAYPDAETWRRDRLIRAAEHGEWVVACGGGSLEDGREWAAVELGEQVSRGQWTAPQQIRRVELAVEEEPFLLWVMRAPAEANHVLSDFEALVQRTTVLPPECWRTAVAEAWVDLDLDGGWRCEAPGVYLDLEHDGLLLTLEQVPSTLALKKLQPRVADTLRSGANLQRTTREENQIGPFRDHQALRYALDGINDEDKPVSVRGLWVATGDMLLTCVIQGADRRRVEDLMARVAESMRPGQA